LITLFNTSIKQGLMAVGC